MRVFVNMFFSYFEFVRRTPISGMSFARGMMNNSLYQASLDPCEMLGMRL